MLLCSFNRNGSHEQCVRLAVHLLVSYTCILLIVGETERAASPDWHVCWFSSCTTETNYK